MDREVVKMFDELAKISKSSHIKRPDETVRAYSLFVFTRRSLKHLAEKGSYGRRLLLMIPDIIEFPDQILELDLNRKLFVKFYPRPYTVVIEKNKTLITAFATNKKYLEGFKILWRTDASK